MDFIKVSNRNNFNNTDNSKQSSSSLLSQSSSSSISSLSSNGNGIGCGNGGLLSGNTKNVNLKNNNLRNITNYNTNNNNNNNSSSSGSNNNNNNNNSTVPTSLSTTDSLNVSNSLATTATATSSSSSSNNINNNSNNKSEGGSVDDPETKNDKDQLVECQRNELFQSSEPLLNNDNYKTISNSKCDEKLLLKFDLNASSCNNNLFKDSKNEEVQEDEDDHERQSLKPLVQEEHENTKKFVAKKPKSIVKSPSTHSFAKDKIVSKPRLSFNCPLDDDLDRHVQFTQHEPSSAGGYSKSDALNPTCSSPTGSLLSHASGGSETSSSSSSNDNSSTEQYSEARPPDGGYGWVVVFASFLVNMIADGVTFSFGVIFVEFLDYFGEGKAKTAWIGSLFMAMPLLSGPIASFLTDRYGCRKVTIVGSIMASTGFVISVFATSTEMLFLTFGVIAGFGLSLCYVAAVVIVAYYFDKRRSFATGLSVCGSGIGTFVFAPLTEILLEEYGWRGTTLIFAGIFLNMCVCGALMRDLEWTTHRAKLKRKNRKLELQASADSFSVSNSTNTGGTNGNLPGTISDDAGKSNDTELLDPDDPRLFSSLITLPTFIKNRERVPPEVLDLLSNHRNVHEVLMQNYPGLLQSRSFSEPFSSHNGISSPDNALLQVPLGDNGMAQESAWMRRRNSHHQKGNRTPTSAYLNDLRMHRHSLTYRGAMLNINRYRLRASSCPDIYRNSMTTIAKEKTAWYQGIDEFKNLFVDILDLSYFADIRFLLFAISNLLLYTWYDVPYVYLADNAIEMGYSKTDASKLISVIGIVNMFGEIFLGWIGDKKNISAGLVYAICMIFCGITVGLVPLFNSYWSLVAISGAFGLFIAANYSLTSIILVELITLEKFTNAYGLLLLVQGIANLIGPPLAGWVYDIIGTYDLSFYLAGIFISLSGLLLLVLPAVEKYKKYSALKRQMPQDKTYQVQAQEITVATKANGTAILGDCFGQKDLLGDAVKV